MWKEERKRNERNKNGERNNKNQTIAVLYHRQKVKSTVDLSSLLLFTISICIFGFHSLRVETEVVVTEEDLPGLEIIFLLVRNMP